MIIIQSQGAAPATRLVLASCKGQLVWRLSCPMPRAHRGTGLLSCAAHQPCFSGGGPNACSPPDISISRGISLQRVKSWRCHHFPQGRGFTQPVVGAKQPSCLHRHRGSGDPPTAQVRRWHVRRVGKATRLGDASCGFSCRHGASWAEQGGAMTAIAYSSDLWAGSCEAGPSFGSCMHPTPGEV